MYCPNCGSYNDDNAAFCGSCGQRLPQTDPAGSNPDAPDGEPYTEMPAQAADTGGDLHPPMQEKKRGKKIGPIIAAVLVIAVAAAAVIFLWILPHQQEKRYTALLDEGNRYLEEMDYEKAEDMFLKAIDIEQKKSEPYVKLADLYLDTGEREKAKDIIAEAKEALPAEERKAVEALEEERKDELDGEGTVYVWTVDPEIEADDIYYLKETDAKAQPYNEMERQMFTDYAVIKQGDSYGLINMDGELLGGMDYEEITSGSGYYLLKSKESVYLPEYDWPMDSFYLYDNEILPAIGIEGDVYGFKGAFYYCGGLHNIFDAYGETAFGPRTWTEPEGAVPVKNSDITLEQALDGGVRDWNEWLAELPGGYGIYCGGEMAEDFIYDSCGSQVSGLLAVEQDGKWGYVDSSGNVVIPIEYDASWTQYVPQYHTVDTEPQDFCYAASEGHVVLVKDGTWEMRDAGGKLVIDPGVFEEIRPLHDGKCWVKYEGCWGVIELTDRNGDKDVAGEEEQGQDDLPFDQQYWVIFREGFRENRIEMSTVDSDMDRQKLCIIWDGGLTLNITDGMSECDQYYLKRAGEWKQIGEYEVLSNYATEVIASNLDVYDSEQNLIVPKTDYSDVNIDELVAETEGNTGEDENSAGFSDEELQGIAASLGVPEGVHVEVKVNGDPYYWDSGRRWLVNVEVYRDGHFAAGAAVDKDTKELIKDIYTYNP